MVSKYRQLVDVPEMGVGMKCADDVKDALIAWKFAVAAKGGVLHANSLTRTCAEQQVLRDAYVHWLNAGKPPPAVAAANVPGRSNHQGGRAIDANTFKVFPSAPADKQVDLLWETGKPLGWSPIIDNPDESQSERWHFDAWNGWLQVKIRLGYDIGCLCSALDVGQAGQWQSDDTLLQALLLRAGFDIGLPDGIWGPRSTKALNLAIGAKRSDPIDQIADALRAKPVSTSWAKIA